MSTFATKVARKMSLKMSFWKLNPWQFRVARTVPWATWYYLGPYAIRVRK